MKFQKGFTLIELMIVVTIIGVLSAVAIPIYSNYTKQSNAQEAPATLLGMKTQIQMYYTDNPATGYAGFPCTAPSSAKNFGYTCAVAKETFTLKAEGIAGTNVAGWTYTITESGGRQSSGIEGVTGTPSCWITKVGGGC